jgi:hypothetical protein
MRISMIGVALALVSVPSSAFGAAPTIAAEKAPDAAAIAAAERLLTAMDYDRLMERTADAMVGQIGPALKKSLEQEIGGPVDDELIKRLTTLQSEFLHATLVNEPNLRRAMAIIYARHFEAAELDRLAELYKDPVMSKWTEVAPALMSDVLPLMLDITGSHRADLIAKAKKITEDYYAEKEKRGGS